MATKDYKALSDKLDKILEQLQDPSISIDEAVVLYEEGDTIVKELEKHLVAVQNTIKKISKD